jgi:hypothetical protein
MDVTVTIAVCAFRLSRANIDVIARQFDVQTMHRYCCPTARVGLAGWPLARVFGFF